MIKTQDDELVKRALQSCDIKSQSDLNHCNDGKRSSDVLIETINKCERLQKQLDIAVNTLEKYADRSNWSDWCACNDDWIDGESCRFFEEDGYSYAEDALAKIKEVNNDVHNKE